MSAWRGVVWQAIRLGVCGLAMALAACASPQEMLGWAADEPFELTPQQRAEFTTRNTVFTRRLAGASFDAGRQCLACGDFSDLNNIGFDHVTQRVRHDYLPMLRNELARSAIFPANADAGGFTLRMSLQSIGHVSSVGADAERRSKVTSGAVLRTTVTIRYEIHDGAQPLESWTVTSTATSNSLAASTRLTENIDGALKRNARAFLLKVVADHGGDDADRASRALAGLQAEVDNKRIALGYVMYGATKTVTTTAGVIGDGLVAVAQNSDAVAASLNERSASLDRMNRANQDAQVRAMSRQRDVSGGGGNSGGSASRAGDSASGGATKAVTSASTATVSASSSRPTAGASGAASSSASTRASAASSPSADTAIGREAPREAQREQEQRRQAEADAKRRADEAAAAKARAKAEHEARERAEKEAHKRTEAEYLQGLRTGARGYARTCPGGEGRYFAMATLPRQDKKIVSCIDVHFRAACPGSASYATGVGKTFVDGTSCFGSDAVELSPKPACRVEDVRVEVTQVRPCGE